jgi:molybdopterin adenylyltransferase
MEDNYVFFTRTSVEQDRRKSMNETEIKVGIIVVSDRASAGEYEDLGGPAVEKWVSDAILSPVTFETVIIPDEKPIIKAKIRTLAATCDLVLTTGGTGPARRDVTVEATEETCSRLLPGFGEAMRAESLKTVPTAILSRATAGLYGYSLVINLPGKPEAIPVCLSAVFLAVPKCLELISVKNVQLDLDFVEKDFA